MPQYTIGANQGSTNMSISRLIDNANAGQAGPLPVISPQPAPQELWVNQMGEQPINATQEPSSTSAIGLITCAAVIMVSSNPNDPPTSAVYHANAGVINAQTLNQMRATIANNPNNLPAWADLYIVYAVARDWDNGYQQQINAINALGVPNDQIAWIENLPINYFGINSMGQVGVPGNPN